MGERLENLLGALTVALGDAVDAEVETAAGRPGAAAAALAVLAQEPGLGIEQLKLPLRRTQSATVRVVDQLVAEGYAERRPGRDRRSVSVFLTETGTAAAGGLLDRRSQVLRDAVAVLDAGERAALGTILEKMLGAMTENFVHSEQICRLCDIHACPAPRCPVGLAAGAAPDENWPAARPIPGRFRHHADAAATHG
jgi:MarR family transcriptional regulator, negative regulator of the multidrug operon emrRAB